MQVDTEDYHFKFKVMVIGDKGVGKTSFLDQVTKNFGKIIESESSDELNLKSVGLMDDNTLYKISYWEIPGQFRNQGYQFRYCLGAASIVYIFDTSKRQTFEKIEQWLQENEKCDIQQKVLLGNKIDLMSNNNSNNVNKSEAMGLARKYGMEYFEICCIGDSSIAPAYDHIFSSIINSIPNPPAPSSLMGKGIILGKRLLNSNKYQLALCDIATLYE